MCCLSIDANQQPFLHACARRHQGLFNASRDINLLSYTLVSLMASHYGTMPGVKLPCGPPEVNPNRKGADCFREYGYGDHDVQSWLEDFATVSVRCIRCMAGLTSGCWMRACMVRGGPSFTLHYW